MATEYDAQHLREKAKHLADDSAKMMHKASDATKEKMKNPTTAAAVVGAAAVSAAVLFGVAQTIVGGAAALVTYRVLRKKHKREKATAAETPA
jgi:hypothetical protein